jgi:hypothetical protein
MNRICDMILEDVMNAVPPAMPAARKLRFRAEARKAGQNFSLKQESLDRDDNSKAYSVVQSVQAANRVFMALQRVYPKPDQARRAMYSLSLDLNLLPRPITARTKLVQVMQRELFSSEQAGYGMAIRLFKQYFNQTMSASQLFDELLKI